MPATEVVGPAADLTPLEHHLMAGEAAHAAPPPVKFSRPLVQPTARHTHSDGTPDEPKGDR